MHSDVTIIFTCYNRKQKTVNCIKSLINKNDGVNFKFIIVDDNSTDGTSDAINNIGINAEIIKGTGNLFWCGGMRVGIERYLNTSHSEDGYVMFINDDVVFHNSAVNLLIEQLHDRRDTAIVGAVCNEAGQFTYGLKIKEKPWKKNITKKVYPCECAEGDTFNANCVLFPREIVECVGNMDTKYSHSLGDYDYGFAVKKAGYRIITSRDYVGVCNDNSIKGTWQDRSLSRIERLKKKESPKGSPFGEWWHFLFKNYGIFAACVHSPIPYIKIVLGL